MITNGIKKLNTPMINKAAEIMADDAITDGIKNLSEDWENREIDKKDPNCTVVYGVSDGKAYGYVEQKDFMEYVKYAAEMRKMEGEQGNNDLWMGKIKWILPRAIELDMVARGYPLNEIIASGDLYDIDCYVEDHCPELKTTKLYLKKAKIPIIKA